MTKQYITLPNRISRFHLWWISITGVCQLLV